MLNDVEHDFAELIQATRVSVLISYPNLSLDGKKIEKDIFSCNFYRLLDTLKMNIQVILQQLIKNPIFSKEQFQIFPNVCKT